MELRSAALPLDPPRRGNTPESIRDAARQLEGEFARMMIGMMRQAALGEALFPGAPPHYRDLHDRELARVLTRGSGLGLQPMIRKALGEQAAEPSARPAQTGYPLDGYRARQPTLQRLRPAPVEPIPVSRVEPSPGHPRAWGPLEARAPSPVEARTPSLDRAPATAYAQSVPDSPEAFVRELWPHAQRAAAELGVSPRALLAQAALETGWGRHMPRRADGSPAHNVFGIKAGRRWQGETLARATTEHVDGRKVREVARFRAYASPAESFADYVALLRDSPRYRSALGQQDPKAFATALQRAGYATDPDYAAKLAAIAEGPTLERALASLSATTRSA